MQATLVAVLASWALTQAAAPGPERCEPPLAPPVVLDDQFQRPHALTAERGDVIVLVYGDRSAAAAVQDCATALHVRFHPTAQGQPATQAQKAPVSVPPGWPENGRLPEVRVTPVACLGGVPGLLVPLVRSQYRSRNPEWPVCLDFGDKMRQFYGLAGAVPNAALIDTRGRVRFLAHGTIGATEFEQMVQFIEQLRREALQPAPPDPPPEGTALAPPGR